MEYKKIIIEALPLFFDRRLKTILGLTKKQFKALRAGQTIEIDKKYFDKKIYREVK